MQSRMISPADSQDIHPDEWRHRSPGVSHRASMDVRHGILGGRRNYSRNGIKAALSKAIWVRNLRASPARSATLRSRKVIKTPLLFPGYVFVLIELPMEPGAMVAGCRPRSDGITPAAVPYGGHLAQGAGGKPPN